MAFKNKTEFFKHIWEMCPHVCYYSGLPLVGYSDALWRKQFILITKHPLYLFDIRNVVMVHPSMVNKFLKSDEYFALRDTLTKYFNGDV